MDSAGPSPLATLEESEVRGEVAQLRTLGECGFQVAPIVVVPPAAEAQFYRLNNLGTRIEGIFEEVDLGDPDDEDVEDLAPLAERLVAGHYLLDEFIDAFYGALEGMPPTLHVRRPGSVGIDSTSGRPSLLAVKRTWSSEWSFPVLWERLSGGGPLVPQARPVLVHAASMGPLPASLSEDAGAVLGRAVQLRGDTHVGITMVDGGAVPG